MSALSAITSEAGKPIKPLAVTVPIALHITGLGRTMLYRLINDGTIETITVGRRRLINFASLERLTSSKSARARAELRRSPSST
jgi:excisionase family DNA binding protein